MTCAICASTIDPNHIAARHVYAPTGQEYKLRSCSVCDGAFWTPLRMEPDFYADETFEVYGSFHAGAGTIQPWHRAFLERHPANIRKRSRRLLDVGCGEGAFIAAASDLGYEVWGIDFDHRSVAAAKERRGLENVHATSVKEFVAGALTSGVTFDIVSFFEVMEHQDDPLDFIRSAGSLLSDGGRLVGSVPNRNRLYASLERRMAGNGDFPPHHFLWFSEKSLRHLFGRAGFEGAEFGRTHSSLKEISAWLEMWMLGSASARGKRWLRSALATNDLPAAVPVSAVHGRRPTQRSAMLMGLRHARDVAFLPLAAAIAPQFNRRGAHLYFEATRI